MVQQERNQCRMVKKDEQRCQNTARLNSPFCWHHILRGKGWPANLAIAALTTILGFAGSCYLSAGSSREAQEDRRRLAFLQSDQPLPHVSGFPVHAVAGANFALGPGDYIRPNFPPYNPFAYRVTRDGELLVSGAIRDPYGRIAAALTESRLTVTPGVEGYDANWNEYALEVIDPNGNPVFQAFVQGPRTIAINYDTFVPDPNDSTVAIAISATGMSHLVGSITKGEVKDNGRRRIFEYPGYKNWGVRAKHR